MKENKIETKFIIFNFDKTNVAKILKIFLPISLKSSTKYINQVQIPPEVL